MKKIYHKLLISSIYTAQNNGMFSDVWKILSNFYIAIALSNNIMFLFIIINRHLFHHSLDFFVVEYTSSGKLNFILNMLMSLILPIITINFLTIYKNGYYKVLIHRYSEYYKKTPFVIYFMLSLIIPILYVLSQVEIRI